MSGNRGCRGDRIGSQGDAADRLNAFNILDRFIEEFADQKAALGMQGGLLAVKVKIALATRSQLYQPFFVGQLQDDLFQLFAITHIYRTPPQIVPSAALPQVWGMQPDNLRQNRLYRNWCY